MRGHGLGSKWAKQSVGSEQGCVSLVLPLVLQAALQPSSFRVPPLHAASYLIMVTSVVIVDISVPSPVGGLCCLLVSFSACTWTISERITPSQLTQDLPHVSRALWNSQGWGLCFCYIAEMVTTKGEMFLPPKCVCACVRSVRNELQWQMQKAWLCKQNRPATLVTVIWTCKLTMSRVEFHFRECGCY